jgi:hypothetical protein
MDAHRKFILGAIGAFCLMVVGAVLCAYIGVPFSSLWKTLMIIQLCYVAFISFILGRESAKKGMWPPCDKADTGTDFDIGS